MSDLSELESTLKSIGASHTIEKLSIEDARALAKMSNEPVAAKSSKYVLLGSTLLHFDFTGKFLGTESTAFEPADKSGTKDNPDDQ